MSMQTLTRNLDTGAHGAAQRQMALDSGLTKFYEKHLLKSDKQNLHGEAKAKRGPEGETLSTLHYLSALAEAEGIAPDDFELKESEDYWLREFKVDPILDRVRSEKVKEYARHRWALEKVLEDNGINLRGPMPSTVHKAFTTNSTLGIFPFTWDAAIQAGMLAMPAIDRMIMADIPVNGNTVDHISLTDSDAKTGITVSGEGVPPSEALLTATNSPITLTKLQTAAKATYEAIQWAHLPVWEAFLRRVGQRLQIAITNLGFERLIAGDGTTLGAAAPTVAAISTGNPSYLDLLAIEADFTMGYEPDVMAVTRRGKQKILAFPQYQDPDAGVLHQTTGRSPSPLGWEMIRWDAATGPGSSSNWADTKVIVGVKGAMLIKYTSGGVLTETEKIIRGQWEVVVTSTRTDYGIWDRQAARVGTGW